MAKKWLISLLLLGACASTDPTDYAAACEAQRPARLAAAQQSRNMEINRSIAISREAIQFYQSHRLPGSGPLIKREQDKIAAAEQRRLVQVTDSEFSQRWCTWRQADAASESNRRAGTIAAGILLGAASDALWVNNIQRAPLETIAPMRRY